jgi:hypothetical protein
MASLVFGLHGNETVSLAVGAQAVQVSAVVTIDPTEWPGDTGHTLTIQFVDADGVSLCRSVETVVNYDKYTGLPQFNISCLRPYYLDSEFPSTERKGAIIMVGLDKFRYVAIANPVEVRITVDTPLTYGVEAQVDR